MEPCLMPAIRLQHATTPKDLIPLRHLLQLYMYDFSVFWEDDDLDAHVDHQGLYDAGIDLESYLDTSTRWAHLVWSGEWLAGFALLRAETVLRPAPGRYIEEFFIMQRYRHKGLGRAAATRLFNSYRGYWEISEIGSNLPAQNFWRRVLSGYTANRYEELTTHEDGMPIVWQTFDSSTWE
jgi:predicted acetyltransferase